MDPMIPAPSLFRTGLVSITSWPPRRWLVAVLVAVAAALAMGVPTGIVPTSFYTRMTPVTWWDYPVWAVSAALLGLIAATYVRSPGGAVSAAPDRAKQSVGAALLSVFAIGCPICNKLLVALIGVSGALTYFAPIQPLLGAASLGLLITGLAVRLRGDRRLHRSSSLRFRKTGPAGRGAGARGRRIPNA